MRFFIISKTKFAYLFKDILYMFENIFLIGIVIIAIINFNKLEFLKNYVLLYSTIMSSYIYLLLLEFVEYSNV